MYRRYQEQIAELRLPEMGLKVSFGYLTSMPYFGSSCGVLAIK